MPTIIESYRFNFWRIKTLPTVGLPTQILFFLTDSIKNVHEDSFAEMSLLVPTQCQTVPDGVGLKKKVMHSLCD